MQQAATRAERAPSSAVDGPPGALTNAFVINLVSSTSPLALTRPDHGGLRRFNFFVSRRREQDGRERFRLHMGYFESQEEAEKLLDIVREIYPGAWAGMAPGRGLRTSVAPEAQSPPPAAPIAQPTANPAARARARAETQISTASAVPAPAARAAAPVAKIPSGPTASPARAVSERPAVVRASGSVRTTTAASGGGPAVGDAGSKPPNAADVSSGASIPTCPPAFPASMSAAIPVSVRTSVPTLSPAVPLARRSTPSAQPSQSPEETLSNSGALRVLEPPAVTTAAKPPPRAPAISHEKHYYAVQLVWSVKPIDMARVPQLAIFSAYVLYGAQGHRDGRRWYGLRLGFFTDAISAKQVAHYVRADFATVSVVPVTDREREQTDRALAASGAGTAVAAAASQTSRPSQPAAASVSPAGAASIDEFKLLDDTATAPIRAAKPLRFEAQAAARSKRGPPGKRAVVRRVGQVQAARKVKSMTLEQTLEILGANQLKVEDAGHTSLDESGVRHLQLQRVKGKPSKLLRLFDRLSERLG